MELAHKPTLFVCYDIIIKIKLVVFFQQAELKKANVKVFQMHSKGRSMILQITEPHEEVSDLQ